MNHPTISLDSTTDELQQQLVELLQQEKKLAAITTTLNQELMHVDQMLQQHAEEWFKHREEHFNQLTAQLETNDITLTKEEQAMLRNDSTTTSNIQTTLATLEKQQIKISNKDSDFAVIANSAIVAALSRNLQKIDPNAIKNIVKNLAVITEEDKAATKLKTDHAKQHQEIATTIKQLQGQIVEVPGISPEKLQRLETTKKQVAISIAAAKKTTAKMR